MLIRKKRTKIVATIGPASEKQAILERMIRAGLNVVRLNFSHGTYANHRILIKNIRAAAKQVGTPVAILADLQGPKVRVGLLPKDGVTLKAGTRVTFRAGSEVGPRGEGARGPTSIIPVSYAGLARDLKKGDRILLNDGLLEVRVEQIRGQDIITKVVTGGKLTSHKGFNVPTATLRIPAVTAKDRQDLRFALKAGVDFIALSFVKSAADLKNARYIFFRSKKDVTTEVKLIAKIEKHEAVRNFDEILEAADGIMVARGDLGIELAAEEVPIIQKQIIRKCLVAAKPVIVATQMLDSMIRNPRPTRAEVSDVANAVIDHTDAVMLSGETASGAYPVQSVETMARIIDETEESHFDDLAIESLPKHLRGQAEAVGELAGALARTPHIKGIVVLSATGETAREISRMRPELPVLACTADPRVARQLNLSWGIIPISHKDLKNTRLFKKGDEVLMVSHEVKIVKWK